MIGAGIIGVCTAYYITRHPNFSPYDHHITILESKRVAGGASGRAGGLLALWAFPQQIVPLSFQLHQELADEYNGGDEWGYRRLTTVSVEGNIQKIIPNTESSHADSIRKNSRITKSPPKVLLPKDLDWIQSDIVNGWSSLGGKDSTAQVHPYKFTNFILKKAMETGAVDLIIGKAQSISYSKENGSAESVTYVPSAAKETANPDVKPITLEADKIIMSVGPWTSKILPDCPISGLRAHSITISTKKNVTPYAIFTELKVGRNKYVSPEIYARVDEVYVCGEGDTLVNVPETTDDVEVVREKCDELFEQAGKISRELAQGTILKRQACYLPVLDVPSSSGPLIGETNVENLYLASGHSCWGINNAPATGKLMAELLFDGEIHSADISALDPSIYFDASA